MRGRVVEAHVTMGLQTPTSEEGGVGMGGAIRRAWRRTRISTFGEFGIKLGFTLGGV